MEYLPSVCSAACPAAIGHGELLAPIRNEQTPAPVGGSSRATRTEFRVEKEGRHVSRGSEFSTSAPIY